MIPRSDAGVAFAVADKIAAYLQQARGPGIVHRVAIEVQRDLLKSGPVAIGPGGGKYSRSQAKRQGRRR